MKIYVSASVKRSGDGSQAAPYQTIQEAAQVAVAGDEVIVLPGVYREWVNPQNGGESDACRITYRSQVPGAAVITGAEPVKTWQMCIRDRSRAYSPSFQPALASLTAAKVSA